MKRTKKLLALVFALMMLVSGMALTAHAEGREALTWPKSDYDFKNEAVTPSPFLGELKVGKNTASSLLKGYYTFSAPESGYYSFNTWFRIADKIENNTVTELSYCGNHGPLSGVIKLEKGDERCLQFYDNSGIEKQTRMSDSYDVTIEFLGESVSVLPQTDTLCPACFYIGTNGKYLITHFPVDFKFSGGSSETHFSFIGTIDGTDIGKHKATLEMPIIGLEDLDIEVTIADHSDADEDGKCDFCDEIMTGEGRCPYCGKIHTADLKGFFTGILHKILAVIAKVLPDIRYMI